MNNNKWVLIATHQHGYKVYETAKTRKGLLTQFDERYTRRGWKITLGLNDTSVPMQTIKKTYR